jgi:hypothetical protein
VTSLVRRGANLNRGVNVRKSLLAVNPKSP